jgi:hypothetical protein
MILVFANMQVPRREDYPTETLFKILGSELPLQIYRLDNKPGDNRAGYVENLKKVWAIDDMIIIEAGCVPKLFDIQILIKCPHSLCNCPELVKGHKFLNARKSAKWDGDNLLSALPVHELDLFADLVGLNCTKISLQAQKKIEEKFKKLEINGFYIDQVICSLIREPWHLHAHVEHVF